MAGHFCQPFAAVGDYHAHMGDEAALRLLDLVRHKLAAADARIEIGGNLPDTERAVWVPLNPHRRVVAVFESAPPEDATTKLAALVEAFVFSADASASDGPVALAPRTFPVEIDAELDGLAVRAQAVCAVLIDASSPVVWGRSHADLTDDVGLMLDIAEAVRAVMPTSTATEPVVSPSLASSGPDDARWLPMDPAALLADESRWPDVLREHVTSKEQARRLLMAALGIHAAREAVADEPTTLGSVHRILRRGGYAFMVRSLGGVYLLILAFEGGFSEPSAEGVVRRGSSQIEKLIVKLPPTDPPPKPGRVLSLRRPNS